MIRLTEVKVVFLSIAATLFMGCQAGFQSSCLNGCAETDNGGTSGDGSNEGDSELPSVPDHSSSAWNELKVEGSVNGGQFDNSKVLDLDKNRQELIVRLPMLASPILGGVTGSIPVPALPNARLTIETLPDGRPALVLRIPLEQVIDGLAFAPATRLPNGDPLPAIPGGELPGLALPITQDGKLTATVYLAPTVVGLYINSPINPYLSLTFPIRNEARTQTLGYFSMIPKKSGFDGGFFISIALPNEIARIIDDHL